MIKGKEFIKINMSMLIMISVLTLLNIFVPVGFYSNFIGNINPFQLMQRSLIFMLTITNILRVYTEI